MKCAPCACTKYGKRLEQPIPAMVVIFSCHSLRFSISLKYSASTEKSPQPGHHVGWSADISFLVRPLRSPFVAGAGAGAAVMFPPRWGISVMGELIFNSFLYLNYCLRSPDVMLSWAFSMISFTLKVRPSVLVMPCIFESQ